MKRRTLIQAMGLGGLGLGLGFRNTYALQFGNINLTSRLDGVSLPSSPMNFNNFPRVINVFLYGGPSELGGNLSNITDINGKSVNKYTAKIADMLDPVSANSGQVTANQFWKSAGGEAMETMIKGGVMSVYRTMYRTKNHDHKAHRESVIQNQLGSFDMDRAGTASVLSELLRAHKEIGTINKELDQMIFPFVSFDSQAQWFSRGDIEVLPALRPVALGNSLADNPYSRDETVSNIGLGSQALDELVERRQAASHTAPLRNAFLSRKSMNDRLAGVTQGGAVGNLLASLNTVASQYSTIANPIVYPAGDFGSKIQAAVSLMLMNPDTVYAAVGGGAMGGWDDHSDALQGDESYPARMQSLMNACLAAMMQIRAAAISKNYPHADSIIINIYGDFGRNVDLNNGIGWDHGNNQNLYTFGGWAFRKPSPTSALGKIVGVTEMDLTTDRGRIFTKPTKESYSFEPFALASTLYKYYGVTNPEVLNDGTPAINETLGATPKAWEPLANSNYIAADTFFTNTKDL